jgi:hypothetical protein
LPKRSCVSSTVLGCRSRASIFSTSVRLFAPLAKMWRPCQINLWSRTHRISGLVRSKLCCTEC